MRLVQKQLMHDACIARQTGSTERIRPRTCSLQVYFQRRNEMLGLGLLGTVLVIVLIVWLARRA